MVGLVGAYSKLSYKTNSPTAFSFLTIFLPPQSRASAQVLYGQLWALGGHSVPLLCAGASADYVA